MQCVIDGLGCCRRLVLKQTEINQQPTLRPSPVLFVIVGLSLFCLCLFSSPSSLVLLTGTWTSHATTQVQLLPFLSELEGQYINPTNKVIEKRLIRLK